MNKTIALAAIVMVAVIMGMSAFVPAAMAARDGPHGQANDAICHLGADGIWVVLFVNTNAVPGHEEDGDIDIADDGTQDDWCINQDGM